MSLPQIRKPLKQSICFRKIGLSCGLKEVELVETWIRKRNHKLFTFSCKIMKWEVWLWCFKPGLMNGSTALSTGICGQVQISWVCTFYLATCSNTGSYTYMSREKDGKLLHRWKPITQKKRPMSAVTCSQQKNANIKNPLVHESWLTDYQTPSYGLTLKWELHGEFLRMFSTTQKIKQDCWKHGIQEAVALTMKVTGLQSILG